LTKANLGDMLLAAYHFQNDKKPASAGFTVTALRGSNFC